MMNKLFKQVLEDKDLSKAGDLFSLEDSAIVDELSHVINRVQEISSQPGFLSSHNDQSLIEICVTRVTSAIRETNSIQQHAKSLVSLLESCLSHSLKPSGRGDPPHAKMASDIMSCIFLNYNKKVVMQLALPVAVKFLHKGNRDLSRNMSSYLSLAAIENADLLAAHIQPILDSVISGNYSLSRVLPQIFAVNRELIKNHVMTLVSILPNCEDSENLALLSLFGLIAKDTPELLEPSIPQLCECLLQQKIAPATLLVLQDVANARPQCLVDHINSFKLTAANFPKTTVSVIQLVSAIGRINQEKSRDMLEYILNVVGGVEKEKHNLVLKEVSAITGKYPSLLTPNVINKISGLEEAATSSTRTAIQELKNEYNLKLIDRSPSKIKISDKTNNTDSNKKITIVTVRGSKTDINIGKDSSRTEIHRGAEVSRTALPTQVVHPLTSTSTERLRTSTPSSISERQGSSKPENTSVFKPDIHNSHSDRVSSSGIIARVGSTGVVTGSSEKHAVPERKISPTRAASTSTERLRLSSSSAAQERQVTSIFTAPERTISPTPTPAASTSTERLRLSSASQIAERQSSSLTATERYPSAASFPSDRYIPSTDRHSLLPTVDRHLSGTSERHSMGLPTPMGLDRQLAASAKSKLSDGSRSTGRLATHRSMTRLNTSASRLDSRMGLHKSMTRLDHAYHSNQAVVPPPAPPTSVPGGTVARSVTCIGNRNAPALPSRSVISSGGVTVTTPPSLGGQPSLPSHSIYGQNPPSLPGAASPTKSMSSGSMTGLTERERDLAGREILTVNINQITTDLARQSHQLSSVFKIPADFNRDSSLPPVSISTSAAPLSLPSHTSRRLPPYSSGPLPTPQPPSLPLQTASQPTITPSSSQPLELRNSRDHLPAHRPTSTDASRSTFSNTLPSLRRRSHHVTAVSTSDGGDIAEKGVANNSSKNRMSVFEPYPMRDTVQHFCEKHLEKIKAYMESAGVKIPLPVKCTIEERKGKKHAKLHFACQGRGDHCLYKTTFYTMKSRNPRTWIHLMFLALQARSQSALSTRDTGVSSLKNCWDILKCEEIPFSTLVTGAFPAAKDQDLIIIELRAHRFFDVFEYNGPRLQWGCFLCNHPERASTFIAEEEPVIEGELKEKKGGKWKIFKKWKSRYFTLSGARMAYKEDKNNTTGITQALDVGSIRSVKVSKSGRNIPKAFEIFTTDKTYVFKAKDSSNAQEWVQCLTVAVAHSQAKDSTLKKLAYGGSLGRLNHGHPRAHSHYHSALPLRTAV